jgi:hypothetical protein
LVPRQQALQELRESTREACDVAQLARGVIWKASLVARAHECVLLSK